jgi:hypothetical protein
MAAKDLFHDAVKNGLQRDGWVVTHDPLVVEIDEIRYEIDLGAEELIAAEKGGRQIAVEIKTFLAPSLTSEFHAALGQFINYRYALAENESDRVLYLAVPVDVYEEFFQLRFIQKILQAERVKLVVYSARREEVVAWIE